MHYRFLSNDDAADSASGGSHRAMEKGRSPGSPDAFFGIVQDDHGASSGRGGLGIGPSESLRSPVPYSPCVKPGLVAELPHPNQDLERRAACCGGAGADLSALPIRRTQAADIDQHHSRIPNARGEAGRASGCTFRAALDLDKCKIRASL